MREGRGPSLPEPPAEHAALHRPQPVHFSGSKTTPGPRLTDLPVALNGGKRSRIRSRGRDVFWVMVILSGICSTYVNFNIGVQIAPNCYYGCTPDVCKRGTVMDKTMPPQNPLQQPSANTGQRSWASWGLHKVRSSRLSIRAMSAADRQ